MVTLVREDVSRRRVLPPSSFLLPPSFPLPFPFLFPSFLRSSSSIHALSCPLLTLSLFLSFSLSPAGNWDGSGGTGAAKTHYEQLLRDTGKNYPLVVKLGTITPDGKGDVYSYAADEDDAVLNPQLKNHLIRLGIDVNILKKTEKSTAELQVSDKRDCLLFVVFSIGRRCVSLFCASLLISLLPPPLPPLPLSSFLPLFPFLLPIFSPSRSNSILIITSVQSQKRVHHSFHSMVLISLVLLILETHAILIQLSKCFFLWMKYVLSMDPPLIMQCQEQH